MKAIPRIPQDPDTRQFNEAVKESLEVLNGVRGGKIKLLSETASSADVIAKVNEILGRMQG